MMNEAFIEDATAFVKSTFYEVRWEMLYAACLYTLWGLTGFLMEIM